MKHINIKHGSIISLIVLFSLSFQACAQSPNFTFEELPYSVDALEPYIDATTVDLHYNKHHRGYYNKFIKAIASTNLENKNIEEIFAETDKIDSFVRNNAGGYYNHTLYWQNMTPNQKEIPNKLKNVLVNNFGSVEEFKTDFNKAAGSVFGSGWAWLVLLPNGKLAISTTANQDNPLMPDVKVHGKPLLALDVWEHAYYIKYQNKRSDYISSFWNVVNWDEVARRYSKK